MDKWIKVMKTKRIFRLFKRRSKTTIPEQQKKVISCERNKIYPVDEFAEARINKTLDDIFEKHHGM